MTAKFEFSFYKKAVFTKKRAESTGILPCLFKRQINTLF
ncbi:hypothetical protein AQPE_3506 [Aquipluma nitroreducens]|uniref:Uncharacterized protein n=1 Tax=Aquipluma nitroreducens TaxID=2010828 RepID=A0A5K7SCJ0_9BACT|nr:hypothetical protein AQPE_3506 [Aquipluma nitroreducens]